jgi:hypothetical protein
MDTGRHVMAETDCCGYLYETWTGDERSTRVDRPSPTRLARIAAAIAQVLATAGHFVSRA